MLVSNGSMMATGCGPGSACSPRSAPHHQRSPGRSPAPASRGGIGAAAYVAPVAFVSVGWLMVARSALVDVRPFRTGLVVTTFGLLATLGSGHGGAIGRGLERLFGLLDKLPQRIEWLLDNSATRSLGTHAPWRDTSA